MFSPTLKKKASLFRSPKRLNDEQFGERSYSFSTSRDTSKKCMEKINFTESDREATSTKIEITGSFVQEKYDNKRETVIFNIS